MKLVVGHTVLLILALALAYQTWARDGTPPDPASVLLWSGDPDDVTRVVYETPRKRAVLEPRRDEAGSYVWVAVTLWSADSAAVADSVVQFVGNEQATSLMEVLAEPRALRDLGAANGEREQEFGLTDSRVALTVEVGGEARALAIGGIVFASGDRYLKDLERSRIYVFSGTTINSLENSESILLERRIHPSISERIATVTVRTERGERTMQKTGGAGPEPAAWVAPDEPDRPDQSFATFITRLQQLSVMNYAPDVDRGSLRSLARIEYADARGRPLEHVELLRADVGGNPEYFVVTDQTRVPARVYRGSAEPLDEDLAQLF